MYDVRIHRFCPSGQSQSHALFGVQGLVESEDVDQFRHAFPCVLRDVLQDLPVFFQDPLDLARDEDSLQFFQVRWAVSCWSSNELQGSI